MTMITDVRTNLIRNEDREDHHSIWKSLERVPAIPATTHANAFERATHNFRFLRVLHANWHDSLASYAKTG